MIRMLTEIEIENMKYIRSSNTIKRYLMCFGSDRAVVWDACDAKCMQREFQHVIQESAVERLWIQSKWACVKPRHAMRASFCFYVYTKSFRSIFIYSLTISVAHWCLQYPFVKASTLGEHQDNRTVSTGRPTSSKRDVSTIIFSLKNEVGGLIKALRLFQVSVLLTFMF